MIPAKSCWITKGSVHPFFLQLITVATKHYDYSPIDWDEFWNVVKGNGAGNKLRLKHHIKAHEDGKWVREAAKSYAQKQNLIQKSA